MLLCRATFMKQRDAVELMVKNNTRKLAIVINSHAGVEEMNRTAQTGPHARVTLKYTKANDVSGESVLFGTLCVFFLFCIFLCDSCSPHICGF